MHKRKPFDIDALTEQSRSSTCFICAFLEGKPEFHHHVIAQDADTIIFLSKYPTMPGYALVCPKAHQEDLATDLSPSQYLKLQSHVHRLSRALKKVFDAERIYVLSLGSQQGNAHLHWHVVPLSKGTPYEKQQYHALMAENGVLEIPDEEMASIATKISDAYHAITD